MNQSLLNFFIHGISNLDPVRSSYLMGSTRASNTEITRLIGLIQNRINAADSIEDLVKAIEEIKQFGQPIKYNHNIHYLTAAILGLFSALFGFYCYSIDSEFSAPIIAAIVVPIVFSVCLLGYAYSRICSISNLSDIIYHKNLLFDNNLTSVDTDTNDRGQRLKNSFYEFNRGNHSREIQALYLGHYKGSEYTFDYHYYHFHYVDKRIVTTTDSKGRISTRTVYDRYDRYGIYLPFSFVANLSVVNDRAPGINGVRFKPASNRFNKYFKVYSDTELNASKFLKPKVVIELEQMSKEVNSLNLEFNAKAELCLSFKDNDLLSAQRKHGIESPDEFIEEIRQFDILPKLRQVLDHIHALMTYTDNNFERTYLR